MTYFTEAVVEYAVTDAPERVMALIDECGKETPITEFDIRRTLKLMSEDKLVEPVVTDFDALMEHVYAARAIA